MPSLAQPRTAEHSTTPPGWRHDRAGRSARTDAGRDAPRSVDSGARQARLEAPAPPRKPLSRSPMPEQRNGRNVGKVIEVKGVVIDAVFTGRAAPDLHRAAHDSRADGDERRPDRRGAAAPRRRPRPRGRDGLHRRPRARRRRGRHRRPDHRSGRQRDARARSGTCSASRRRQAARAARAASAGRSTATRLPSTTSRRRPRSSRPASRSST